MKELRTPILIAQGDHGDPLLPYLAVDGYRVEEVYDASTFLTIYARFKPALVVLDSALTGGDGFSLCARLREQTAMPIILLIPNDEAAADHAYQAGANDVLITPVNAIMLRRHVRCLLETETMRRQLGENERRWQQMFERSRTIQLLVDPDSGYILDANPAACAFYGYSRDALRHRLMADLEVSNSHPDDLDAPDNSRFQHRTAAGDLRRVKIFSTPIEADGQTRLNLTIFDLTPSQQDQAAEAEHRTLAEALRNTAAALSSTLNQSEVLDRILDQVQNVVPSDCANIMLIEAGIARVQRSRGYDAFMDQTVVDEIRFKVRDTPNLNWMVENNQAMAIPDISQFPGWIPSDPGFNWIKSFCAAPIRIGNYVIGFLNLDSQIRHRFSPTDADHLQAFADQAAIAIRNARLYDRVRRQAANMERRVSQRTAELEYERSQLRAIIEAMTEGVAYTEYFEGEFHTRYINELLARMTGYSLDDWHTHSINLFRDKNTSAEVFDQTVADALDALRTTGCWRQEARITRHDGTQFDAMLISSRIDGQTELNGVVTVVRDISQEKALREQKERFVAYASHELRTPITNLKTRLYLMRRQPAKIEDHMRVLEQVTDRMKRLVEDLLDVSRFERGVIRLDFQPVRLQDIIDNLVMTQRPEAEQKQIEIGCDLPETPIIVSADAERLAQVITNLLTNAINYTLPGGRIDVRLKQTVVNQQARATVEVSDSGIGISEENLGLIFQPFYRVISQVEGTGLGLSITKEIVELHGGEIGVRSVLGEGSCFCFWLPILHPEGQV